MDASATEDPDRAPDVAPEAGGDRGSEEPSVEAGLDGAIEDGSSDAPEDSVDEQISCTRTACDDNNPCTSNHCAVAWFGAGRILACGYTLVDHDHDGHASTSFGTCGDDCDDWNAAVHPLAREACDGIDNDCDGRPETPREWYPDCDFDGFAASLTGSVSGCPASAPTSCGGEGGWTELAPTAAPQQDCDDRNPGRFPGNPESCDGIDNDCAGGVDDARVWADCDRDGFATADAKTQSACGTAVPSACPSGAFTPADPARKGIDCNDFDPKIHPLVESDKDCAAGPGVDDNCDGVVDGQRWFADCDRDGYAAVSAAGYVQSCGTSDPAPPPQCASGGWTRLEPLPGSADCADADATVHPGALGAKQRSPTAGWDYDCDGVTTKTDPLPVNVLETAPCVYDRGTCSGETGWTGRVPACGEEAVLSVCGCAPCELGSRYCFCFSCSRSFAPRVQQCR